MLDYAITNGTLVDGTGSEPAVGTSCPWRRIVTMAARGGLDESSRETFDATGLLVTPGLSTPTLTTTRSSLGRLCHPSSCME